MDAGRRRTLGVVVPTLDEAEQLPRLLARLAGEDAPDALVVSDGGSSDGTVRLAAEHGVRVVAGPRGRGTQLARGARELGTELLCFLHADALPEPGALDALRRAFGRSRPSGPDGTPGARDDERDTVVAAALRQRIDAEGFFYRLVEHSADRRVRRRGLVLGDSGLTVRREVYQACGGFRDLPLFEDVDLSRRLRRLGRVVLADAYVGVSARRWQREGPLRRTVRNRILRCAYALGVDPHRLARHYRTPARREGSSDRAGVGRRS